MFYLPGVCTHNDTEGKQRKARVRNILKKSEKTQYLMNTLYKSWLGRINMKHFTQCVNNTRKYNMLKYNAKHLSITPVHTTCASLTFFWSVVRPAAGFTSAGSSWPCFQGSWEGWRKLKAPPSPQLHKWQLIQKGFTVYLCDCVLYCFWCNMHCQQIFIGFLQTINYRVLSSSITWAEFWWGGVERLTISLPLRTK